MRKGCTDPGCNKQPEAVVQLEDLHNTIVGLKNPYGENRAARRRYAQELKKLKKPGKHMS